MTKPVKRLLQVGLVLMMSVVAMASPFSVSARSTHDVVRYDKQHIATLEDGTEIYLETLSTHGKRSKELKAAKDWKAYAEETTLEVTTSQAAAGYYDPVNWYTAGCRITAYSGIGPIYYYQLTHDYGYTTYHQGLLDYQYIAAEGSTDPAWATWFGWNVTAHSTSGPYVMSYTSLPTGQRFPYQEYMVGNYQMGHGVTTPWGNIIVETRAGWVKPVYGPQGQVRCYMA